MKICVHRGTQEIGGTCIEIEAEGKRVVLDVGLPLDAGEYDEESLLPEVSGFKQLDDSLLAVIISHPHQDHYGLAKYLRPGIQVIIGQAAKQILNAAINFSPSGVAFKNTISLQDRVSIQLGPFEITPFLVDHSAYDAYSLLISAGGKRIFYSGDFRGHGRKAGLFEKFIANPPKDVDVLLMEGTVIGRADDEEPETEDDLVSEFVRELDSAEGLTLIWSSGQNIDRIVTIFKACIQVKRQLIIDLYTAEILRATGNEKLPQGTWKGIRVYLPEYQRRQAKRLKMFDEVNHYRANRIFPENMKEEASRSVLLFRPTMAGDLESAKCLKGATLIYSLWEGYLNMDSQRPFKKWMERNQIPLKKIHTSGHASLFDLKRFADRISPKTLVPIHSFNTDQFLEYFERVEEKQDGAWWEV
jgi:ribonuclease J